VHCTKDEQLRALGAQLALYLRNREKPASRAALQALAADLTAEVPDLGQPLSDLLGRPGFQALIPLAGKGKGEVQRDALIKDAGQLYLPDVVAALREVLNGFLECSSSTTRTVRSEVARPEPRIVGSTSVRDLARRLGVNRDEVIIWLASRGVIATATQTLDPPTTEAVCKEFGQTKVHGQRKDPNQAASSWPERRDMNCHGRIDVRPGKGRSPGKKLVRACSLAMLWLVGCGALGASATPTMAGICLVILFVLTVVILGS
jgi:hypothetical protein